jgi:hypothetical protein
MEKNTKNSKESRGKMDTPEYFEMMKYYDEAAAKAKGRIWTITSWILALNAGIIAYSLEFYVDHKALNFLSFELIFCAVGIVLCSFTLSLIGDH